MSFDSAQNRSRSLPATPTLETLKKQAKKILKVYKDGNVSCCATLKRLCRFKSKSDAEILNSALKLAEAQFALAMDYGSDARVRLRNLRIRFFKPTRLQVEEYGADAATNWTNYKRREIEAGRRKSMDDDSL